MLLIAVVILIVNIIIAGYYLWRFISLTVQINSVNFIYLADSPAPAVELMRDFGYNRTAFFVMLAVVALSVGFVLLAKRTERLSSSPKTVEKEEPTPEISPLPKLPHRLTADDIFGAPESVEVPLDISELPDHEPSDEL